jgi:hypothetical protein
VGQRTASRRIPQRIPAGFGFARHPLDRSADPAPARLTDSRVSESRGHRHAAGPGICSSARPASPPPVPPARRPHPGHRKVCSRCRPWTRLAHCSHRQIGMWNRRTQVRRTISSWYCDSTRPRVSGPPQSGHCAGSGYLDLFVYVIGNRPVVVRTMGEPRLTPRAFRMVLRLAAGERSGLAPGGALCRL